MGKRERGERSEERRRVVTAGTPGRGVVARRPREEVRGLVMVVLMVLLVVVKVEMGVVVVDLGGWSWSCGGDVGGGVFVERR